MFSWINTLTLAYYFSGDKRYADQAALLIKSWFINPQTRMNPNLNYAQIIKGTNKGNAGGIIDTANMPQIIDDIGILNEANVFSASDTVSLNSWFSTYLNWLQSSSSGKYIAAATSNQRTWYDGQVISIALFLNKTDTAKKVASADKEKLIQEEIDPEGKQPQELSRTKSWDYSAYNLQALCNLADLSKNVNIDLWNYQTKDQRGIKKAIEYLLSYVVSDKKWPYKQISPLNKRQMDMPLFHASAGYNKLQYWNIGKNMEGSSGLNNINILIYQVPTAY